MGRKLLDLTGMRFGRLVAVEYLGREHHSSVWRCLCDCGNETKTQSGALKNKTIMSCGCYRTERMGTLNLTHGMRSRIGKTDPVYKAWDSMKQRCHNPMDKAWKWYGGRGIKVCDRWFASVETFAQDMGPRPAGTSIERKDGNLGYEPDNCVWATPTQQARNRSNNHIVTFQGQSMTLVEAAELAGLPYKTVKSRICKGWSEHESLTRPVDRERVARANNARVGGARSK
jgi:hypothetical protein